ncbi:MAG: hypothetical protein O9270_13895 [Aquidulcibacter sp.]|jgi:NADP-dependent 3-hydroxy acid dehydrogenase YdfG|uniref:hypothetical protein n=1 Tax=Aquidulcibacter sp. TaxID=2052990 RepID=UPI0022C95525|nr:hypothetical protein [Aquidulcibacter sp.]MCE2890923.1 hypothetical protein [Hyphomonadaceae bacterium]MCZ8209273.1 hypothetical protein [Aquidulcibacter sp.]
MNRPKSKTTFVTGGAVGIDRACANSMAEVGANDETKFVTGAALALDGGYSAR